MDGAQKNRRGEICYDRKHLEAFPVLTVCIDGHDANKRRALVPRLLGEKANNLFWFSTLDKLAIENPEAKSYYDPTPALLGPIWKVPTSEEPLSLFEI